MISLVNDVGVFAFRDSNGIRPLVLGQRVNADGKDEWCEAPEDAAFGPLGFKFVRELKSRRSDYHHQRREDGVETVRICKRMPVHFRIHLFGQTRFDHELCFRVLIPVGFRSAVGASHH